MILKQLARAFAAAILTASCLVTFAGAAAAAQFARAKYEGKAHLPGCGDGGFIDLVGKCWQCPDGFEHDNFLLPPDHPRVCRADTQFHAGVKHGAAVAGCPTGQWPSLHNGYCYSCPDDFAHNILFNGDDSRVCWRKEPVHVEFSKGIKHGKSVLGLGCPRGQWPSLHNGHCYTCPGGFAHDVARNGDDGRVCYRRTGGATVQQKGIRHAKANVGVCPAGQWVSLHDGACYTCPAGYSHDIARTGNDGSVCFRRQQSFSRATRSGGLLCDRGFFDPVRGGTCWSCPANAGIRTVARVDSDRACTNELGAIAAVDVCRPLVAALRDGQKGLATVQTILQTIIGPVLQPINQLTGQVTGRLQSPKELDHLIEQLGRPLRPYGDQLSELQRLQAQLNRSADAVRDVVLDPDVVCGGDLRAFDRKIAALGLQPKPSGRRSWLDGWLIRDAHAQARSAFTAITATLDLGSIGSPINTFGVTGVTNFQGQGGVFLSVGRSVGGAPTGDVSVGLMLFPSVTLDEFEGVQDLGAEVSFDVEQIRKMFRKEAAGGATANAATPAGTVPVPAEGNGGTMSKIPDAIDVSFDPRFNKIPGFGVSKGHDLGAGSGARPVSFSVDVSVKLR